MLCAVTSHKSWGLPGALYGCTSFVTYCCDCSLDPQKTVPKDELLIFLAGDFGRPSIFCLADPQSSFVNNWECLVTTEEDPFIGLRLKRRSRRTPWTPLLLVFGQGEQRVLVVPYENSRDLDNQLCLLFYLYLTGGDQQQPGGSSRPSLEKAKALFASPELAALLEVDSLAACRLAQTKRKPRKRQRDESAAYFWRRCFEQQNQQFEALLSKNLTGQKSFLELWRRYWEIQQLSRAPLEYVSPPPSPFSFVFSSSIFAHYSPALVKSPKTEFGDLVMAQATGERSTQGVLCRPSQPSMGIGSWQT
ncbi:hypothetical protein QOT17_003378 [Balamuthia mandrillaris]